MSVVQISEQRALTGGFYTIGEAARILRIDSVAKVRRWVGSARAGAPVIVGQYQGRTPTDEVGFYDLLEIRFVDYFRRQGVSLQSIRAAAESARRDLQHTHPFALSNVKFVTDRKKIFLHTAEAIGDDRLMDIVSGQHAMYDVIESFLAKGVEFNPSGLAKEWRPEPANYPDVVLHPLRAHGQPVLEPFGVPTSALFQLWRAEDQDYDRVADWFEIDRSKIEQAIEYELELAA